MFKRIMIFVFAVFIFAGTASASVTKEQFELRSGHDLLALCSVDAQDPLYAAALHLCHGFGVGVYRTIIEVQASQPDTDPIICQPTGETLTRNQYFEHFVEWASAHPENHKETAIDLLARYLRIEFACKK